MCVDHNTKPYKVVCYLGSWANYRHGPGLFLIEHIDPYVCTHLVYGFAKIAGNQIRAYDPYLDLKENWGLGTVLTASLYSHTRLGLQLVESLLCVGAFQRFNNLRKENPNLSTLIAIGGWNEGSVKYSNMVSSKENRTIFVDSVLSFLEKYEFDGLDMDWEYPANRGGKPEDKENYILLLKELQAAFAPQGYLLTAAVSAGQKTIDTAYNISEVAKYLDFINLMAYDFHGSWETIAGHNAPLYGKADDSDYMKILNVDYAINYWLSHGAPASKIIMGMGTYGRSFTLEDANKNGLGEKVQGKGKSGPMTKEEGMLGYNEICKFVKSDGWTRVWDNDYKAPYAYHGNQWVGYDDLPSIKIKLSLIPMLQTEYLKKKGLGGGMVWSLETDDFRGNCGDGKYPIITEIMEGLNGRIVRPPTTPAPPTTQGPPTSPRPTFPTLPPGYKYPCTTEGAFPHPHDCTRYFRCMRNSNGDLFSFIERCPP
ncbi:Cht9, partial [Cordylochernes scorpioides]